MSSLMIIGTAHVIDLSSPLEGFIREFNPNIIALELDRERWFALQSKTKRTGGPLLLRILSEIQRNLGNYFGSSPGSEMVIAGNIGRALGADIKLIDKPILPTLMGAWRNMPWVEFWRFIKDTIFSLIQDNSTNLVNSIKTGDFTEELKVFSEDYPVTKFHLIDKRDIFMSKNLVKLFRNNKNSRIAAIVGEGHVDGMSNILSQLNPKIIRLRDLLSRKNNTINFSIKI